MLLKKIYGTIVNTFSIGKDGPLIKNNSGVIEIKNTLDSAFARLKAGDPVDTQDVVTKAFGDANYLGVVSGSLIKVANGRNVSEIGTTNSNFQERLTVTFNANANDHLVLMSANLTSSANNGRAEYRYRHNTTTLQERFLRPNKAGHYTSAYYMDIISLPSGSQTFDIYWRRPTGGGQARIADAKIIIFEIT